MSESLDDLTNPVSSSTAGQGEQLYALGFSEAFLDKALRPGFSHAAYGGSFVQSARTRAQIVEHQLAGKAITVARFTGNTRKNETFLSQRIFAVDAESADRDVSVADALAVDLVRRYAFLVYPSASSGRVTPQNPRGYKRTRILFAMSEAVEGVERARAVARALCDAVGLPTDSASFKPAQPYMGSRNRVEAPYINLDAELPIEIAGALTIDQALDEMLRETAPKLPTVPVTGTRAERYAASAKDGLLRDYYAVPGGTGQRHGAYVNLAAALITRHKGDWPGFDDAVADLRAAGRATERTNAEIESAIKWAQQTVDALPLALPTRSPHQSTAPRPYALPTVTGDINLALRYVSDAPAELLPTEGALIVRSPMNTGKTRLAARLIARLGAALGRSARVLVITHRQALAHDLTDRLNREGLHFECYKGLTGADLRRIDRLVICANSTPKLIAGIGAALPSYDAVFIDESEQVLDHFGGGTFRKGDAITAHETVRALIAAARLAVLMDAHAGERSRTWLREAGKTPHVLTNSVVVERGTLALYDSREALIHAVNRLAADQAGPVVIPTSSKREAKRLARYYTRQMGADAVYMVCSENSESFETQAFIRTINQRLPQLRIFIYTASLGTGVDITCPVRAVCGVFGVQPLSAPEMMQMIGRCRNTQETHVFIKPAEGHAETNAEAIYTHYVENALRTRKAIRINEGVVSLSAEQQRITRLLSTCEADRNRSANNLRGHFVALAEGYTIRYVEGGDDPALRAELAQDGEAVNAEEKQAVLSAEPLSYEAFDQKRQTGDLTPADRAGLERYRIEDTSGQTITPPLYDELHTPADRAKLVRFADLGDTHAHTIEVDRTEAADNVPAPKLKHRARQRSVARRLIRDVFGDKLSADLVLTGEQIAGRMADFLETGLDELRTLYGWRSDQSDNPVALLRWVLEKRYGLKLVSRQIRIGGGQRQRVYSLDPERLVVMSYNARCRLAHLERQRAEREAYPGGDLKRGEDDPRAQVEPTAAEPVGWASPEGEAVLIARMAALTQPIGGCW